MKFKIKNGSGNISIGLSEIGSYFRFDYPLSLVWHDNRGSVGKYFCLLPFNQTYRDELRNKLLANLNNDFSNKIEELYDLLKPLFTLFKNGEYSLSYSRENVFQYQTSGDTEIHYMPLELAFTEATTISEVEDVIEKHQAFLKENAVTEKYCSSNILEYTTYNLYDGSNCFFSTQPDTCINQERVAYFEQQITSGERPFVIIMQASHTSIDLQSSYFIIDGHHKLLAYEKLGIYPAVALITYLPSSIEELEFDAESLAALLYPWQIRDVLENWDEKDNYILEKLKNPGSPLHMFIKNGHVKEYHDNKALKHEAFYINDKVDGKSLEWYDNGQLKYEHFYSNRKKIGVWKNYYPSGKILFVQPFDDMHRCDGEVIAYYESGQKSRLEILKNGKNVDGPTHLTWFESGSKQAELKYLDGRMIEMKNWNSYELLTNHQVYNEQENKFIKQPIINNQYPEIIKNPLTIDVRNDLNIIRERQYPETNYKAIWRMAALLLLMFMTLLRMCR